MVVLEGLEGNESGKEVRRSVFRTRFVVLMLGLLEFVGKCFQKYQKYFQILKGSSTLWISGNIFYISIASRQSGINFKL